eukprot:412151-Pelagomonas_calceolata.AAC.1
MKIFPSIFKETLHAFAYCSEVSNEDVFQSLRQGLNQLCCFISDIMDVLCASGRDQQAEQSNHLAEAKNPMCPNLT